MDALEFIREKNRMCKSFGEGEGGVCCPLYLCSCDINLKILKIILIGGS